MSYDNEKLREQITHLEQSRERERTLRLQAEALLAGLLPLAQAENTTEIFSTLVDVLHEFLDFDEAFLLVDSQECLTTVAATAERFLDTRWHPKNLFDRVLTGKPTSVFDISQIEEWIEQPEEVRRGFRSALHIPLAGTNTRAILIITHGERGAFDQNCIHFAARVGPLAAQALFNIERRQEVLRRRQRERQQEASFRLLIENSPDAIWISRQGIVVYANQALVSLLGYDTPAELIGGPDSILIAEEDLDDYQRRFEDLNTVGLSTAPRELRLRCADGSSAYLEVVGLCLHFNQEPALSCLGRDIKERKELMGRIMQIDRMIATGTLAAGVGHEINNPLAFVLANIEFALDGLDGFDDHDLPEGLLQEIGEALDSARVGGERIAAIVRELRTFSDSTDTKPQAVELNPLILSARQMVWNQIRHRARYVESLGEIPHVVGTEPQLAQVFLNLLNNAAQAIPVGQAEDHRIEVRTYLRGEEVIVEIEDTGAGIPEENLGNIFDPFFTTKSPDEGTGLGLAISRRNIISYGGRIEVESQVGVGTTFRVVLPTATSPAPFYTGIETTTVEMETELPPNLSVLVIDDEERVGQAVDRLLRDVADVTALSRAEEALELLGVGAHFDFILCDLLMPQISGMEFYHRLLQSRPEIIDRLIFMTGGILLEEVRDFLDEIPNPHIFKPFRRTILVDILRGEFH